MVRLPEVAPPTPAAVVNVATIARRPNVAIAGGSRVEVKKRPETTRFSEGLVMALFYPTACTAATPRFRLDAISTSFAADP